MARLHDEPDDVGPAGDPEDGASGEEGARRGHPKADGDGDDSPRPGPRVEADEAEVPPSEEDVLAALRRGDSNDSERADALRAAAIAQQVAERLRRDEAGLRIDTLALFNDSVSVGGGFSVGSPPATAPATDAEDFRVVAEDELARHVDHYVHPPEFGAAIEIVRDRRLLILSAAPGTGREAAAYNLLVEVLATGTEDDDGAVYVVTDSRIAARPGWTPGHRSSGYLLMVDEAGHTGSAGWAESAALTLGAIDGRWITETAAKLKEADSFMVVVADTPYEELLETLRRSMHVLPRLGTIEPVHHEGGQMNPDPPRVRELRVDGIRTVLREVSPAHDREAVVFIHGNPGSSADWAGLLERVGGFCRAVAWDAPGFGKADKPRDFTQTVDGHADFINKTLDTLGIDRAHLVVHDFGGPWGMRWAATHPDQFASAVLVNTGVLLDYRWHVLARIWRTPVVGELFMAITTRFGFCALLRRGNPRGLPREFLDRMLRRLRPRHPERGAAVVPGYRPRRVGPSPLGGPPLHSTVPRSSCGERVIRTSQWPKRRSRLAPSRARI